jgi:hypothetical protein
VGLVDSQGNVMIFLDRLSHIDNAIQSRSFAKFFHQDKIGQTCLFAFDESKRMLAVYASARVCRYMHRLCPFDPDRFSIRCSYTSSYSTKSLNPYEGLGPQSTFFHSIIRGYLLFMHVSFMEVKRFYLSIRALKRGFTL